MWNCKNCKHNVQGTELNKDNKPTTIIQVCDAVRPVRRINTTKVIQEWCPYDDEKDRLRLTESIYFT